MSNFKHGFYFIFFIGTFSYRYYHILLLLVHLKPTLSVSVTQEKKKKNQGINRKTNSFVQKTLRQDVYYTISEVANESFSTNQVFVKIAFFYFILSFFQLAFRPNS